MQELRTTRLALEPQTRAHAPELFVALSDPRIYRYLDEEPQASVEAMAERFARLETRLSSDGRERWLNWVVREIATEKAVGFVQSSVREDGSALVAYVITPAAQGRGLAREATEAMIEELRSSYGVKRLRASVDPDNLASIALLLALGFAHTRTDDDGDRIFERQATFAEATRLAPPRIPKPTPTGN
jgi:RimJ/RimL family protein N-acetyltransferase